MIDDRSIWVVRHRDRQVDSGEGGAEPHVPGKLRILIVVPIVPFPPMWGFAQRALQLIRRIAEVHSVTVLTYALPDQRPDVEGLAGLVDEVVAVVRSEPTTTSRRVDQVLSLGSRMPFHANSLRSREFQRAFDQLIRRGAFDLVQLESSQMGWLSIPRGLPVIVDEHNIESELLGRMADSERTRLRRAFNRWEAHRYSALEDRMWARAAGCAVTSLPDAQTLAARNPDVAVEVVPNGVDLDYFRASGGPPNPERVLFTGLLDYRPNLDGVTWFVNEILPAIRVARPRIEFLVVGGASPDVAETLRSLGVEATGRVPDLRPYLDSAAVCVVPLRFGGGTRLKVIEAMSMSKPIVSTSLGAEGIQARAGEDLLIADDAESFATAVADLLGDAARAAELGEAARRLVEWRYSWANSADALMDLHKSALGRIEGVSDSMRDPANGARATEGGPVSR